MPLSDGLGVSVGMTSARRRTHRSALGSACLSERGGVAGRRRIVLAALAGALIAAGAPAQGTAASTPSAGAPAQGTAATPCAAGVRAPPAAGGAAPPRPRGGVGPGHARRRPRLPAARLHPARRAAPPPPATALPRPRAVASVD